LFPKADVVISKMLWSCYLPLEYRYVHFGGNVEKEDIATGIRPLLGGSRVFTYEDVNGYKQALENWEAPQQIEDQKIQQTQSKLKSNFRLSSANEQADFLNQVRQEIGFAENLKRDRESGVTSVALFKIEVPTSGQLYRFAKTVIEDEQLFLTFQYTRGWIYSLIKILIVLIVRRRIKIRSLYLDIKNRLYSNKDFWMKLKTPAGVKWLLVLGAFIFFFLSKFLFVIFVLLFLIVWIRPDLITGRRVKSSAGKKKKTKKTGTK
jgi:hypothetical protein